MSRVTKHDYQNYQDQWQIQDFTLGGANPWGGPTSSAGSFQQKCMQKMKELGPIEGACDPPDPPMKTH